LPTFRQGLGCLAPFGHLISFGQAGGPPDRVDPRSLFGKALKVSGFAVPMVYAMREIHRRCVDEVFRLAKEGKLAIPIGARFPLFEAAAAMRLLESRRSTGKLLLVP
ncbi:MAG TPA: zinc-binding dehydrogenase, partial [Candidatus Binataceae bacterium]